MLPDLAPLLRPFGGGWGDSWGRLASCPPTSVFHQERALPGSTPPSLLSENASSSMKSPRSLHCVGDAGGSRVEESHAAEATTRAHPPGPEGAGEFTGD